MTVKEYLLKSFTLDKLIKAKEQQIKELDKLRLRINDTTSDDNSKTSLSIADRRKNAIENINTLLNEYLTEIDKLLEIKRNIKQIIGAVENQTYQLILTERYINLKHWEDVAVDNNYSWQGVHAIHNKALKKCGLK